MKQRDILLILIPTLLLVVLWIIFNIYHNSVSSTVSKNISTEIVPINPDFDFQTIEELKKRKIIDPVYELSPQTLSSSTNTDAQATSSASQEPENTENIKDIIAPTEIPDKTGPLPSPGVSS
ncbi:MAG: hypothetical protein QXO70_02515, partial [Candidatus Pacearchaeota archaeon]